MRASSGGYVLRSGFFISPSGSAPSGTVGSPTRGPPTGSGSRSNGPAPFDAVPSSLESSSPSGLLGGSPRRGGLAVPLPARSGDGGRSFENRTRETASTSLGDASSPSNRTTALATSTSDLVPQRDR